MLLDGLALLSLLVSNSSCCVILHLVVRKDWQKVSLKEDSLPPRHSYFLPSHLIHQSRILNTKICQVLFSYMSMCWVGKVLLRKECFSLSEATSATSSNIFILVNPIYWWHHKSQWKVQAEKQNKESQEGFSLTDLHIIHVYSTVARYQISIQSSVTGGTIHAFFSSFNHLNYLRLKKGRVLPPCSSKKPSIHSNFSTYASI